MHLARVWIRDLLPRNFTTITISHSEGQSRVLHQSGGVVPSRSGGVVPLYVLWMDSHWKTHTSGSGE